MQVDVTAVVAVVTREVCKGARDMLAYVDDPLGIAKALKGAIGAGMQLYETLQAVKGRPAALESFTSHLRMIRGILDTMNTPASQPPAGAEPCIRIICALLTEAHNFVREGLRQNDLMAYLQLSEEKVRFISSDSNK